MGERGEGVVKAADLSKKQTDNKRDNKTDKHSKSINGLRGKMEELDRYDNLITKGSVRVQ